MRVRRAATKDAVLGAQLASVRIMNLVRRPWSKGLDAHAKPFFPAAWGYGALPRPPEGHATVYTQATIEIDPPFVDIDYFCPRPFERFEEPNMDYFRNSMGTAKKDTRDGGIDKRSNIRGNGLSGTDTNDVPSDPPFDYIHYSCSMSRERSDEPDMHYFRNSMDLEKKDVSDGGTFKHSDGSDL